MNKAANKNNSNQDFHFAVSPLWIILKLFGVIPYSMDAKKKEPKISKRDFLLISINLIVHTFLAIVYASNSNLFKEYGPGLVRNGFQATMTLTAILMVACILHQIFKRANSFQFLSLMSEFDGKVSRKFYFTFKFFNCFLLQVILIKKQQNFLKQNRFIKVYVSAFISVHLLVYFFLLRDLLDPLMHKSYSPTITNSYVLYFVLQLLLAMPLTFSCLAIHSRLEILKSNLRWVTLLRSPTISTNLTYFRYCFLDQNPNFVFVLNADMKFKVLENVASLYGTLCNGIDLVNSTFSFLVRRLSEAKSAFNALKFSDTSLHLFLLAEQRFLILYCDQNLQCRRWNSHNFISYYDTKCIQ